MYQIEVRVKFRIGHRLVGSYTGKCNNVHGEGITAIFVFQKEDLNEDGMVMDFGVTKNAIKSYVDKHLDHAYVYNVVEDDVVGSFLKNEGLKVFPIEGNPTSERLAHCLFQKIQEEFLIGLHLVKVGIVESFEDTI
jgi:6-pyruvoyltetrahydropterin/6-carboxytetrahydropterin synthase